MKNHAPHKNVNLLSVLISVLVLCFNLFSSGLLKNGFGAKGGHFHLPDFQVPVKNYVNIGIGTITISSASRAAVYDLNVPIPLNKVFLKPGNNILNAVSKNEFGTSGLLPSFQSFLIQNDKFGPLVDEKGVLTITPRNAGQGYQTVEITIHGISSKILSSDIALKNDYPFNLHINYNKLLQAVLPIIRQISNQGASQDNRVKKAKTITIMNYFINITFDPFGANIYTNAKDQGFPVIIDSLDLALDLQEQGMTIFHISLDNLKSLYESEDIFYGYPIYVGSN